MSGESTDGESGLAGDCTDGGDSGDSGVLGDCTDGGDWGEIGDCTDGGDTGDWGEIGDGADTGDWAETGDCAEGDAGDCADTGDWALATEATDWTLADCTSAAAASSRAWANGPAIAVMLVALQSPIMRASSLQPLFAASMVPTWLASCSVISVMGRCSLRLMVTPSVVFVPGPAQTAARLAPPMAVTAVAATTTVHVRDFWGDWSVMVGPLLDQWSEVDRCPTSRRSPDQR